jgi:hypothetical protein
MADIQKLLNEVGAVGLTPDDIPRDGTGTLQTSLIFQVLYLNTLPGVVKLDPWLEPFSETLKRRYVRSKEWIDRIKSSEGSLETFSRVSYQKMTDCHCATKNKESDCVYRATRSLA